MGMASLGVWGGESWYPDREGWISASLSVPVHPRVTGALDLSREGGDLDTLFQDLPILLFVFTHSVCCMNCILGKKMERQLSCGETGLIFSFSIRQGVTLLIHF